MVPNIIRRGLGLGFDSLYITLNWVSNFWASTKRCFFDEGVLSSRFSSGFRTEGSELRFRGLGLESFRVPSKYRRALRLLKVAAEDFCRSTGSVIFCRCCNCQQNKETLIVKQSSSNSSSYLKTPGVQRCSVQDSLSSRPTQQAVKITASRQADFTLQRAPSSIRLKGTVEA